MSSTRTTKQVVPGHEMRRGGWTVLVGVACVSAAGLSLEIALTRVFAVTQFYHFAFLTVSTALLGIGASGSALSAFPRLGPGRPRRWAGWAALQGLTTLGAYLATNALPFDSFAIAWDRSQVVYLAATYLGLATPFFFGGLIVGALLSGPAGAPSSHLVYGANLVGAGAGCIVGLAALDRVGADGAVALAAAIAMSGAMAFSWKVHPRLSPVLVTTTATGGLVLVALTTPGWLDMAMSPYKDLPAALRYPGAQVVSTTWDRGTRIELVRSEGIRSLPGLSFGHVGVPPRQDGLTFDGDELSPVPRVPPEQAEFVPHMLGSLPYRLRSGADALVLEPRGGLDVLVAVAAGADRVVAVEPHGGAVAATRLEAPSPYDLPGVEVRVADPRAFVETGAERFDVIQVALTSPYRPVTSGAYSLVEDYRFTVESFLHSQELLLPDGILAAARWVQDPPSEETRLLAIAAESMRRKRLDPASAIVMLRSYSVALLLVQPDGWDVGELATIRAFAREERFDLVAMPGLLPEETNRFNQVPDERYSALATALLSESDPGLVYASHRYDISPPTDDRPFFGHYFTWAQTPEVLDNLGRTWQPFGGAGYFVLLAFLALSTLAAVGLILAPTALRRSVLDPIPADGPPPRLWTLGYFSALGVAFLFVEIPLVQQYILLAGHPATAFAVVLFVILVASGAGSIWSPRMGWRVAAASLTVAAAGYPFLLRWATPALLGLGPFPRIVLGTLLLVPLGFLMGVMFPSGLAHLERHGPTLIPWAWAINGSVSVVSAVGAALLALSFGFSVVVVSGAAAYAVASALAWRVTPPGSTGRPPLTARPG